MAEIEPIFEKINLKENLKINKTLISSTKEKNKLKFQDIKNKIIKYPTQLILDKDKGKLLDKKTEFLKPKLKKIKEKVNKKDFVGQFLK